MAIALFSTRHPELVNTVHRDVDDPDGAEMSVELFYPHENGGTYLANASVEPMDADRASRRVGCETASLRLQGVSS